MIFNVLVIDATQGHRALLSLWSALKPMLTDGKRFWLSVRAETRTIDQSAKFHAMCSDIAKSGKTWGGKKRTALQWKVLLVSGHATATSEGSEILPGLEGEFINLRESTALMSKARGSSLIEYSLAWCAINEIPLNDPDSYRNLGLL